MDLKRRDIQFIKTNGESYERKIERDFYEEVHLSKMYEPFNRKGYKRLAKRKRV